MEPSKNAPARRVVYSFNSKAKLETKPQTQTPKKKKSGLRSITPTKVARFNANYGAAKPQIVSSLRRLVGHAGEETPVPSRRTERKVRTQLAVPVIRVDQCLPHQPTGLSFLSKSKRQNIVPLPSLVRLNTPSGRRLGGSRDPSPTLGRCTPPVPTDRSGETVPCTSRKHLIRRLKVALLSPQQLSAKV